MSRKMSVPDQFAVEVATRLRDGRCPHGLPLSVLAEPVEGFVKGATPVRPLCDACVMEAVRGAFRALCLENADASR